MACGNSEQANNEVMRQESAELTFKAEKFSSEKCFGDDCATVKVNYLIAEGGELAERYNTDMHEFIMSYFSFESTHENIDAAAAEFLDDFIEVKEEFNSVGGWFKELDVELTYETDSTLSFRYSHTVYAGGAHPESSISYANYDKATGKFLSIDLIVLDEQKLLAIAEQAFREFHEVEDGVSLEEDGRFFLPETGFFLANAMGYADDKFVLTYNPYEIGPYVMGYTELEFDVKELEGIIRTK